MNRLWQRAFAWAGGLGAGMALSAAPAVTTFSPTEGPPGTQVVINGSGFSSATEVRFDTKPADFVAQADTRMVAVVPVEGLTGRISVSNPTGTGMSAGFFLVTPRIVALNPPRSATNTVVTIEGFNFEAVTNVLFGGHPAAFNIATPGQIRATVPAGATNAPVTVASPAGAATSGSDFIVTGPAPIVDAFVPAIASVGTPVQIHGANFSNPVTVKFNTTTAPGAFAAAQTLINVQVPAGATTGKITVTTAGGTFTSSNNFVVTSAPIIERVTPTFGTIGTEVLIEGSNFNGVTNVSFNGTNVGGIGRPAEGQLSVFVPPGATTGPIRVSNASGTGTNATPFVVTQAPIIEAIDPPFGGPGAPIVIHGANFVGVPTNGGVRFSGRAAASYTAANTQINTFVPAGATSGPVTVSNSFGVSTSSFNFVVTGGGPVITAVEPPRGPRGTEVIIHGVNFQNPVTVRYNGVADPTAAATAISQIRSRVPANATTGPLTVTTSAGTATSVLPFYLPPRLTNFTPTNGIVGSSVVITGANFVNVMKVLFNDTPWAFTVNATNKLTAVVPTNATTGRLTLETPGGVILGTNAFRVLPNIDSFSPVLGPAGTEVAIDGTGFYNVNGVSFNGVAAAFSNVSPFRVTARVPNTAATGPIRVGTPDGTAASADPFTVTFDSDLAIRVEPSVPFLAPGEPLTYTLQVTNNGPSIVTGVTVTNVLPAGMNFVAAQSTQGECVNTGSLVSCNVGILTNRGGVVITIQAAPSLEGVLTNRAGVSFTESDFSTFNNFATAATVVVSNLSRTLRIDPPVSGSAVVLSWPVSPVPFTLQSIHQLSASNTWTSVTNVPAVIGGRNTVTNPVDDASRFYRLRL